MPLLWIKEVKPQIYVACWEIKQESFEWLRQSVALTTIEILQLENVKIPAKKIQFLAARAALQSLCQEQNIDYQGLWKDETQKPFLKNHDAFVSISHTENYALAIFSREKNVGIDVEKVSMQIQKVASKVFNPQEIVFLANDLSEYTALWSAKEAVYKLYGKKQLHFKTQIVLVDFSKKLSQNSFSINLCLPSHTEIVFCQAQGLGEYIWVIATTSYEKNEN